jgi:hypothetical protein
VWPTSELIRTAGLALWLGPAYYPTLAVVQRVRVRSGEVPAEVRRIRDFLVRRRFRSAEWQIGPSAQPSGLVRSLRSLGFRDGSDPVLKALALSEPPDGASSDAVVRRVDSLDDFERFYEIQQSAFESDSERIALGRPGLAAAWEAEQGAQHVATYLAYVDGDPVATARATFTRAGVVLNGGSTLHAARGRGAYRALVAARWDDAVARGTPHLVTQARSTSYPILRAMGFEDVCDIRSFEDEF